MGSILMRRSRYRLLQSRERIELFGRTKADSVCFAQSTIDCARFGNSHLSAPYKRRDVGPIRVAVAYKTLGASCFVDRGFEYPACDRWFRRRVIYGCRNRRAASTIGNREEASVGDIPFTVEELEVTSFN